MGVVRDSNGNITKMWDGSGHFIENPTGGDFANYANPADYFNWQHAQKEKPAKVKSAPKAQPTGAQPNTGKQVNNTNASVAGANVGDWIIRKDGTKVQLTQRDIDWAKSKMQPAQPMSKPVVAQPAQRTQPMNKTEGKPVTEQQAREIARQQVAKTASNNRMSRYSEALAAQPQAVQSSNNPRSKNSGYSAVRAGERVKAAWNKANNSYLNGAEKSKLWLNNLQTSGKNKLGLTLLKPGVDMAQENFGE